MMISRPFIFHSSTTTTALCLSATHTLQPLMFGFISLRRHFSLSLLILMTRDLVVRISCLLSSHSLLSCPLLVLVCRVKVTRISGDLTERERGVGDDNIFFFIPHFVPFVSTACSRDSKISIQSQKEKKE